VAEALDQPRGAAARVLADPEHRDDDVLGYELEVDVVLLAHEGADARPGAVRFAHVHSEPERVPGENAGAPDEPLVEDVEPRDPADLLPGALHPFDGLLEELRPANYRLPAGGVERGGEQGARARRLGQRDAAIDDIRVDVLLPAQVQDRGLREAAEQLVDRGEHQVCSALEGARRQLGGEAQVRAPGLVDDQRHTVGVRDLRQALHVRDGSEVGR